MSRTTSGTAGTRLLNTFRVASNPAQPKLDRIVYARARPDTAAYNMSATAARSLSSSATVASRAAWL